MMDKLYGIKFALLSIVLALMLGFTLPACSTEAPAPAPAPMPMPAPTPAPADEPEAGEPEPGEPEPVVEEPEAEEPKEEAEKLTMSAAAFGEGEAIPPKYSCKGENVSPQLTWSGVPSGTQAFVLIVNDPDAPSGTFIHWMVIDIPADVRELPEAANKELPSGAVHGRNDFGISDYGGPCPPGGSAHRYQFTLYALDKPLGLSRGALKWQVLDGMAAHVLAEVQIVGIFKR
jgi:Raf kinase inhibitor-like YbhB/YbcL family protein